MRALPLALLLLAAAPALAQGRRGPDAAPARGSAAPDLELQRLTAAKTPTGQTVKLSDAWAKKPVALVFGSYTWPPFRRSASAINALYAKYKDSVTFFIVYIREAHASDSRRPDRGTDVKEPTTFGERLGVAKTCQADLGLKLPMLIDDMRNSADRAYSGWPDRLFLVDTQGKVAFRGDRGPRGFKVAELGAAIEALTGKKAGKKAGTKRTPAELEALREKLKAQRKASLGK